MIIGFDWDGTLVKKRFQSAGRIFPFPKIPAAVINDPHWRKPEPGMLLFASGYLDGAADMLYIGDMDSDREAARATGAQYLDTTAWHGDGYDAAR